MKKKRILAMAMALAAVMMITACGDADTPAETPGETPAETPGEEPSGEDGDNVLKVQFNVEVASMDPQIATDGTSFEVIAAVTEGLYSVDADGSAIPAMVDTVEKSEDGLTYTFKLKDANWSNGTPVTADDFVFAWRRLVDPEVASEYAFIMGVAGVKNADAISSGEVAVEELGVTAEDEKTLVVELDFPVPYFESLMSFPSFLPMNEEFFTSVGDNYGTSPETLLANGPFKVTAYEPAATTISLEKNADYWDADAVALDGIQYQVIKDSQQTMLSYQNGDLDIATLSGEQVEQFMNDPEFVNVVAGYLWYVSPNQLVAGLENVNIRTGMALAFDKDAIANNILKDGSIPANFPVPTMLATGPDGKDFRETAGTYLETDKAKAVEYFEAGLAELGVTELTYTMLVEDTEASINVAQFLQSEWQTTLPGLTVELQTMPKKNRVERMQAGDYELVLTRWGPDYADPMTYLDMWTTGSSNNYGSWSNAEYDAIIEDAKKGDLALDLEARWEALKDAEKIVMDEAVIMPVYQKGDAVMVRSGVEGVEFHSVGINRVFKNATKN
ncbi:peptide ABC transporter substrate-binding protein [Proteiniclasticum sp. SCR006]|uniref:Peptide ABC transporter substrate-binding protein n=1 Tax=Proteiniclasticum aestuarii TaxID=2817862 RepID=A0A939HAG8_9CLOT|nr:peptide ABC transporter substrate-binding protein [Proteiniclasticum aestuarii]MBO1265549.1 peptide ABC transporter substrate-binding protein [Proteiniclasticum aestuarii]